MIEYSGFVRIVDISGLGNIDRYIYCFLALERIVERIEYLAYRLIRCLRISL